MGKDETHKYVWVLAIWLKHAFSGNLMFVTIYHEFLRVNISKHTIGSVILCVCVYVCALSHIREFEPHSAKCQLQWESELQMCHHHASQTRLTLSQIDYLTLHFEFIQMNIICFHFVVYFAHNWIQNFLKYHRHLHSSMAIM